MIDCYTWMTDNGYKPRIMLEETGLEHRIVPVNLREKAQMAPEFMKISPGHKIPAIVDHDGPGGATVSVCESGAILKYLGEKSGKFYPKDGAARAKVDQWLFYGSATFTTLSQQFGHWTIRSPIKAPPAQEHYEANLRDMLGILDRHLENHVFGRAHSRRQRHRSCGLCSREALARCDRGASGGAARLEAVCLMQAVICMMQALGRA
jgi:GST-like protein